MRILLIEDDSGLGSAVRDQLEAEGHSPDWVQTLADAGDAARLETLLDKLEHDKRILAAMPTAAQKTMLERIRKVLGSKQLPAPVVKKTPAKRPTSVARKPAAAAVASSEAAPQAVAKPKAAAKPKRATPVKAPAAKAAES